MQNYIKIDNINSSRVQAALSVDASFYMDNQFLFSFQVTTDNFKKFLNLPDDATIVQDQQFGYNIHTMR